jgi:hypothetical protein
LERKREKALKTINRQTFLDVLMGGTNNLAQDDSKELNKEDEYKKVCSIGLIFFISQMIK